jgi:hypothetical protein
MPRFRGMVQLPTFVKGWWHIESPPGTRIFDQPYPEGILKHEKTLDVEAYSALVYVNGGLSSQAGAKRRITQNVYITVTPGVSSEFVNRVRETPSLVVTEGAYRLLPNKFRTVVTIS